MQALGNGDPCNFCLKWDRGLIVEEAYEDELLSNHEAALAGQNVANIVACFSAQPLSDFTGSVISKIEGICKELLYLMIVREKRKIALARLSEKMREADTALGLQLCECQQLGPKKEFWQQETVSLIQRVTVLDCDIEKLEQKTRHCCLKLFALNNPECASDSISELEVELAHSDNAGFPIVRRVCETTSMLTERAYASVCNFFGTRKKYVDQAALEGKHWGGVIGAPRLGEAAGYILGMVALASGKSPNHNPLTAYEEYWQGIYSSNTIDAISSVDNSSLFSSIQTEKMRNYFKNYLEDLDHCVAYAHAIKDNLSLGSLLDEHKKIYETWCEIYHGSGGKSKQERFALWIECISARVDKIRQEERYCLTKLVEAAAQAILSPYKQYAIENELGFVSGDDPSENTGRIEKKLRRYAYRLNELKELKSHLIQEVAPDKPQIISLNQSQNNPFLKKEGVLDNLPGKKHTRLYEQLLYQPSNNVIPRLYCHVSSLLQNVVWRNHADLVHDHESGSTLLHAIAERGSEKVLSAVKLAIDGKNQFLLVPSDRVQRWRLKHILDYRVKRADGLDCFDLAKRAGNTDFLKNLIELAMAELPASFTSMDFVKRLMASGTSQFEGEMYARGFGLDDNWDQLSEEYGEFIITLLKEDGEEHFFSFSSSSSSAD